MINHRPEKGNDKVGNERSRKGFMGNEGGLNQAQAQAIKEKIAAGEAGQYEAAVLWQELERLSVASSSPLETPAERDSQESFNECSDEAVELLAIIENGDAEEGCAAVCELRKLLPNVDKYVLAEVDDQIEIGAKISNLLTPTVIVRGCPYMCKRCGDPCSYQEGHKLVDGMEHLCEKHATPAPADTGAVAENEIAETCMRCKRLFDEAESRRAVMTGGPNSKFIGAVCLDGCNKPLQATSGGGVALHAAMKNVVTGDTPQPQEYLCPKCHGSELKLADGMIECSCWTCDYYAPISEFLAALGKTPDALTHAKALLKDCYLYFNARPEIDIVHATAEQLRAEIGLFLGSIPLKEKV